MKKSVTKFVLASASMFVLGSAMAQTDTTKSPTDTSNVPAPTDTLSKPGTSNLNAVTAHNTIDALAAQLNKSVSNFYAITNKELLDSRQYVIKTEEETEA